MNQSVYKMQETVKKRPLEFPRTWDNVFKSILLSDQLSKIWNIPKIFILYNVNKKRERKKRKATNSHILRSWNQWVCGLFRLINAVNDQLFIKLWLIIIPLIDWLVNWLTVWAAIWRSLLGTCLGSRTAQSCWCASRAAALQLTSDLPAELPNVAYYHIIVVIINNLSLKGHRMFLSSACWALTGQFLFSPADSSIAQQSFAVWVLGPPIV